VIPQPASNKTKAPSVSVRISMTKTPSQARMNRKTATHLEGYTCRVLLNELSRATGSRRGH